MKVKANITYRDQVLNRTVSKDEVIEVSDERANLLTTKLFNGVPFCTAVEEEKEETVEETGETAKPKNRKRNGKR